jgi:riboflavin kinase/FMN adenylyltransferase
VVGHDFSFGKGRAGTLALLRTELGRHGAEVVVVPAVAVEDPAGGEPIVCSSTFVRREVQAGQPERAALVLGRAVELEGEVVHGAARGRTLGFPTANLRCATDLQPAVGIYAAWAELLTGAPMLGESEPAQPTPDVVLPRRPQERHPAAVSVGYNATFVTGDPASSPISIEAYLIQPPGAAPLAEFYGRTLRLHLARRLRDELRFSSVEALVEQIHLDVAESKRRLGVAW